MHPLILAVVVIGLLWAARGAGRGVKKAYSKRLKAWRKRHKNAPRIMQHAAAWGQAFAMVRHGPPALLEGWKEGWREGKAVGEEWVERHWPDSKSAVSRKKPNQAKQGEQPKTSDRKIPKQQPEESQTRPKLSVVKPKTLAEESTGSSVQVEKIRYPQPTGGQVDMSGEVSNPETLLAALQEKLQRAVTERDDAVAATARAEGEKAATEQILAAMKAHAFKQDHVAMVAPLVDAEAAAVEACKARQAAADASAATAQKSEEMATQHIQMQAQGAAGTFYNG